MDIRIRSLIESVCGGECKDNENGIVTSLVNQKAIENVLSPEDNVTLIPMETNVDSEYPFGKLLITEKNMNESFNFNKIQSDEFEDNGHRGFEYKYYDSNDDLIVEVETWDDGDTLVNNWYNVKSQPFNIFAKLKKQYKSLKDFEKDLDKLLVN